jgi:hypothetical protein
MCLGIAAWRLCRLGKVNVGAENGHLKYYLLELVGSAWPGAGDVRRGRWSQAFNNLPLQLSMCVGITSCRPCKLRRANMGAK